MNTKTGWVNHTRSLLRLMPWCAMLYASVSLCSAQTLSPNLVFGRYRQFVWDGAAGQPSSAIYSIAQTKDGYLWLATADGALRFDGVTSTLFDGKALKLDWGAVKSIVAAADGSLGVATRNHGFSRYKNPAYSLRTRCRPVPTLPSEPWKIAPATFGSPPRAAA